MALKGFDSILKEMGNHQESLNWAGTRPRKPSGRRPLNAKWELEGTRSTKEAGKTTEEKKSRRRWMELPDESGKWQDSFC